MLNKKYIILVLLFLSHCCFAQTYDGTGFGQTIQINTHLTAFVGKPSWLLVIRDIDSGVTVPYMFDFEKNDNFWVALTYSRNYVISISNLQFSPYHRDPYYQKRINDFCHLESHGRIMRGESIYVTITGKLTPHYQYDCHVMHYPNGIFTVVEPEPEE